jgi:hypothetical protein
LCGFFSIENARRKLSILKDALVHFYSFDGAAFMPAWAMNLKYAPIINELKLSWESATLTGGR